jgi:hypothetical protein
MTINVHENLADGKVEEGPARGRPGPGQPIERLRGSSLEALQYATRSIGFGCDEEARLRRGRGGAAFRRRRRSRQRRALRLIKASAGVQES